MNIYEKTAIEQLPRLLTLIDRNPGSATYGCLDRNFWHYRITDFPSMRMQEAALTLALASRKNTGISRQLLTQLSRAAIEFWAENLAGDGSASEWYPNEKSYVATAFSTYAAAEAASITGASDKAKDALSKSSRWLSGRKEHRVQNQQSGAIAAIMTANKLLKESTLSRHAETLTEDLTGRQTSEGWFNEYGGPDIGYLSLTADYLMKAATAAEGENRKKLESAAAKAVGFISAFLHPDYTTGGEYGSRNTEYLIPHGIELLSPKTEAAARTSSFLTQALRRRTIAGPYSLDDRYLAYNLYTYLQAAETHNDRKEYKPRLQNRSFEKAQIHIRANKNYQIIINCAKGGVFTLFANQRYSDSGIMLLTGKGACTSGALGKPRITHSNEKGAETFTIEGRFTALKPNILTPAKNMALRAFQITAGRSAAISKALKENLRDRLITEAKEAPYGFKRTIKLGEKEITVEDEISPATGIKKAYTGKASHLYIPSAKMWNASDNQQSQEISITGNPAIITRRFTKEKQERF